MLRIKTQKHFLGNSAITHFICVSPFQNALVPQFNFLDVFPKVTCKPPKEVINMELGPQQSYKEPGMDLRAFCSETFQRPYKVQHASAFKPLLGKSLLISLWPKQVI